MARRPPNPKITAYRRYSWLNIGTLLFGAIFIYMIITVILYLTARHITSYEVTAGSISGNYRYTALALKNETVETAPYSGYVTYYARNGARTGSGSTVCAISDSPAPSQTSGEAALTDEDEQNLKTMAKSFALNFDQSTFRQVYTLKSDLDTYLVQASSGGEDTVSSLANLVTAPASGFVVYQTDGMEALTEADLSLELFNRNDYQTENLCLNDQASYGDSLYKLVQGEDWALYFPLSADLAADLADRQTIRFRFLKDDTTFFAGFSLIQNEDGYFGKLSLKNSLVRYVTDRYLDIELLLDSKAGLKVPTSAIAEKVFYQIPEEYVIANPDSETEVSLIRETFRSDGSSDVSTITATVYDKQDGNYLLSPDLFQEGDYVQMPNTTKKHQITADDRVQIQGVFNINKGYAVFREVTILDENEEFCVVASNNPYGLSAHDFIALDASTVSDDDIVY